MEKLRLETVAMELMTLSYHYPEAGHTPETIELISRDYFDDLRREHISEETFVEAIGICRRDCRYWPKVHDLVVASAKIDRARCGGCLLLDNGGQFTDADVARNREHLKMINDALADGMTFEEIALMLEDVLGVVQ